MVWDVEEFIQGPFKCDHFKILNNNFFDHGAGFDIETTQTTDDEGCHKAYMYIWQFAIDEDVIIGRTWKDFLLLCNYLSRCLYLSEGRKLLCFIHNQSFEFSFFKNIIPWEWRQRDPGDDIFFISPREPVRGLSKFYIDFRDSEILSGYSLKKTAEHYCNTQKMSGDLDYKIPRNAYTVLSDKELQYCINDAVICKEYADFILNRFTDKIPLTKTSIVRNDIKEAFKDEYAGRNEDKKAYKKEIFNAFPYTVDEYEEWMRYLYAGGFVHANFEHVGEEIIDPDMTGYDFKSSYPDEGTKPLPWRFKKIPATNEMLNKWIKKTPDFVGFKRQSFSMIIDITVKCMSINGVHSVFSKHKLKSYKGPLLQDNGRIRYCKEARLLLTNYDYMNLCDFYDFKIVKIHELKIAENRLLPDFVLRCLYKYYNNKNTLPKDTIEYLASKEMLNAIYGMMCTGLIKDNLTYNPITGVGEPGEKERSFAAIKSQQIILPQWGIWISAGARRKLLKFFDIMQSDAIYGDTDSAKIINASKYKKIINTYNRKTIDYHKWLAKKTGYDFGKLGIFECEGKIKRFKTLGCKRYIYEDNIHNQHVTIAGLPKETLIKYAVEHNMDLFKAFDNELFVQSYATGKLTSCYTDEPYEDVIIDQQGHKQLMKEKSGVCLYDIPFNMHLTADYLEYIQTLKENRQYKFGIRGI